MNELRILLVDDHEIVRAGVRLLIEAQAGMSVVGEAESGEEAVKKAGELKPDLVVMDISMPRLNVLKAAKKICEINPQIRVLILTRHDDIGYLRTMIKAGVNGYILKKSAPGEFIRAVRAVAEGKSYLDQSLTKRVFDGYLNRSINLRGENKAGISEREQEVLRLTAWGYSNKEIGARLEISVKTIEAKKAAGMRKLELQTRVDIVRYSLLQGWLQDD